MLASGESHLVETLQQIAKQKSAACLGYTGKRPVCTTRSYEGYVCDDHLILLSSSSNDGSIC